jgi:glutathione peroxidase
MVEIVRRTVLFGIPATLAMPAYAGEADERTARTRARDFTFPSIEGGTLDLAAQSGRVLLVVNTASFCGFTYQYRALEKLHADLGSNGLTVVGVPSQDFNQEKATDGEVKQFCEATFGVQFPMADITHVRGPQAHPFYRWVRAFDGWEPEWNFNKVLVSRSGVIAGHFGSADEPGGPRVMAAVQKQLGIAA